MVTLTEEEEFGLKIYFNAYLKGRSSKEKLSKNDNYEMFRAGFLSAVSIMNGDHEKLTED